MLPRVTAYCTCEAYKLVATQKFLTEQHSVQGAVIYDEALYGRYNLPLCNGEGGFRVQSGDPKKADDSSREYSSDSETQVKSSKRVNGEELEGDGNVGSSAMLDAQVNDDTALLFSPPKQSIDERMTVHFLEEEDQKRQEQPAPEESPERPLKRRDSTPYDVNALANLAECSSISPSTHLTWCSIRIFLRGGRVLELYRTARTRYPSRLDIRLEFPTPVS